MIYVFLGKDFSIVNNKINELVASLNLNNIIKYDFTESSLREIIDEVNYVDLFNEKKLIIVSYFSLKKLKTDEEEMLIKYIDNMNDNIIIFRCIDESFDERKKIVKKLREKCNIEEIKKLDYKDLNEYISNLLKENNIKYTFNQVKRILDLCDYNPDYTINEVNKLIIYKINENELYDEDIDNVISKNTEKEMFTFIENVMKKNIGASIDSYKILIAGNTDEIVIIDNLAKQFRLLYQIKVLNKMNELELSRNLGVNPYVIKKLYPFVREYNEEEIIDILYKLSEVDSDIKIKGIDKNQALEMFLLSL